MPPPAIAANQGLSFLIGRFYYNYVALLSNHLTEKGLDAHLVPGMGSILFVLFEEEDLTMKEVADRAGIAASTLTAMVRRMEQAKLLVRSRDAADGRSYRLSLTPLARSLESQCFLVSRDINHELTAGLSPAERDTLNSLLARVARNIETACSSHRERSQC
jgi:DNA-binding MarR family transcriptional regulator